jgi:hypothetical protein
MTVLPSPDRPTTYRAATLRGWDAESTESRLFASVYVKGSLKIVVSWTKSGRVRSASLLNHNEQRDALYGSDRHYASKLGRVHLWLDETDIVAEQADTLSSTMAQGLETYAQAEAAEHRNVVPKFVVTARTRGALAARNLIVYGTGQSGYVLTDIGREKAAELFPEYRDWLARVMVRTSACANTWHRSLIAVSAYGRMLCPECPADQPTIVDTAIKHMREIRDPGTSSARFRWLVDQLGELAVQMTSEQRDECSQRARAEFYPAKAKTALVQRSLVPPTVVEQI